MTDSRKFKRFVIFAEMRTGSNLLEATLNAIRRVTCFGEAFNPYMMGWPDKDELKGITRAERDADPMRLLQALFDKPDHLPGFRYFHDHDPRVFNALIEDHECAKIILTRNPVDSHVSTVIARETNQWKLNETETPIPAAIHFDGEEFRRNLNAIEAFQLRVFHRLQTSGQAGFWLGYEDLRDADVMTGLLHWLGRTDLERVEPASDQVPQNPSQLADKVTNFDEMKEVLSSLDPFALHQIPNFEPRRGPGVPGFFTCEAGRGLIFMPLRASLVRPAVNCLEKLGQTTRNHTQAELRQWKRGHAGHRSFAILRHPLRRAWAAFTAMVKGGNADLRQLMREVYRVALPPDEELGVMSEMQQEVRFAEFLDFLRRNLNGQTTLMVHPNWASQSETLAGFARFAMPDALIREEDMARDLPGVMRAAGIEALPPLDAIPERMPEFLQDKSLHRAARAAYLRDYIAFGFD